MDVYCNQKKDNMYSFQVQTKHFQELNWHFATKEVKQIGKIYMEKITLFFNHNQTGRYNKKIVKLDYKTKIDLETKRKIHCQILID